MEDVRLPDTNNNKSYSLRPRSIAKTNDDEEEEIVWKKKTRRKSKKPPPLSKYRRKNANARERCRMREINEAFDTLRRCVPLADTKEPDKLTKISTLRMAMRYISVLTEALTENRETCQLPPTPPVSDSPLSPSPEMTNLDDFSEFDPFSDAALDLDDLFFT